VNSIELVEVGFALRTHGVKGHIRIHFNEDMKEFSAGEALFLLQKTQKIPFFIKTIEYLTDLEAFVLFEEITSKEDAATFTKKPVYAAANTKQETVEETLPGLTGYMVLDASGTAVGTVTDVDDLQAYLLLTVDYKGVAKLIPMHADITVSISHSEKTITLKIPDGLLEI
jgi:16S rRNA processing protein RimM